MTGVHFKCPKKVYIPFDCPIKATPAAEPIESILPPTPAVRVTSNHCESGIEGSMVNTANITGMLSTIADKIPTSMLAFVAPKSVYINAETYSKYPMKPNPPTAKITPKKN